jgi:hypothetical protein
MTRARLIAALLITAALSVLMGWQVRREQMVKACLQSGGAWDGSGCGPPTVRPILRRDLQRS